MLEKLKSGVCNFANGVVSFAGGTIGQQIADMAKGFYTVEGLDTQTICVPATRVENSRRNGRANKNMDTPNLIPSGSVFLVPINTAALLIDNGQVVDYVVADTQDLAGEYVAHINSQPSYFSSDTSFGSKLKAFGKEYLDRLVSAGVVSTQAFLIYINLRKFGDIKVGGSFNFQDRATKESGRVGVNGTVSIRVENPMRFYEQVVSQPNRTYKVSDFVNSYNIRETINASLPQLGSALRMSLVDDYNAAGQIIQRPLSAIDLDAEGPRYIIDSLANFDRVSSVCSPLGVTLDRDGSQSLFVNVDKDFVERVSKRQSTLQAAVDYCNPMLAAGRLADATGTAMVDAANNSNGAVNGFMGMGMMQGQQGAVNGLFGQAAQMGVNQPQSYPMNGVVVPQQPQPAVQQPQPAVQPQPQSTTDTWTCACGHSGNTLGFCANCGKPKPAPQAAVSGATWSCPSCGYTANSMGFCANCGKPKPKAAASFKCDKCGWVPSDPTNPPKFCPNCGDVFDDNDITL